MLQLDPNSLAGLFEQTYCTFALLLIGVALAVLAISSLASRLSRRRDPGRAAPERRSAGSRTPWRERHFSDGGATDLAFSTTGAFRRPL